jgi:hypothetical protein
MKMPRGTATLIGRIDTDWAPMSAAGVIGATLIVIFAHLAQRDRPPRPISSSAGFSPAIS